jgi:hypothetical protein
VCSRADDGELRTIADDLRLCTIANDCAVLPPVSVQYKAMSDTGSVTAPNDFRSLWYGQRQATNETEKGVAAGASIQFSTHTGTWIAAQREAKLLLLLRQPEGG